MSCVETQKVLYCKFFEFRKRSSAFCCVKALNKINEFDCQLEPAVVPLVEVSQIPITNRIVFEAAKTVG